MKVKVNLILTVFSFLDGYRLVKKRSQCDDAGEEYQQKLTLDGCAKACRATAQNFAFGTNEFGKNRCNGILCDCFCEFGTYKYQCNKITVHDGFNLYAFIGRYQIFSIDTLVIKAILLLLYLRDGPLVFLIIYYSLLINSLFLGCKKIRL